MITNTCIDAYIQTCTDTLTYDYYTESAMHHLDTEFSTVVFNTHTKTELNNLLNNDYGTSYFKNQFVHRTSI